jgi:hypothetical protein
LADIAVAPHPSAQPLWRPPSGVYEADFAIPADIRGPSGLSKQAIDDALKHALQIGRHQHRNLS